MRNWLLAAVVMTAVLVGTVNGYVYTWQDSPLGSDVEPDFTNEYVMVNVYDDLITSRHQIYKYSEGMEHTISYPTTYWATSLCYIASDVKYWGVALYDVNNVIIGNYYTTSMNVNSRYEWVFSGGKIYEYCDGGEVANWSISTIPYYVKFTGYYTSSVKNARIDDIVIGASEERVVVSAPPPTWFIGKDFIEPAFHGLYSAPNTIIYSDEMHCQYSNNAGSQTIYLTGPDGVVYNTTTVSDYTGIITYDLSDTFFNTSAPYGIYTISSLGSSYSETFVYKACAITGTNIAWDNTTYTQDETATISYNISETYWIPDDYRYYVKVESADLTDLESWEITTRPTPSTQSVTVDTTTFPVDGTYYCTLYAVDRSSLEEILLDYDEAYMDVDAAAGTVTVSGTTYDAINSTALGSCTVTATQLGAPSATTSNAIDGSYTIPTLSEDFSIGMNASKTGWDCSPVYFTPPDAGTYTVDLGLVPSGGAVPGAWSDCTGGQSTADSSSGANTSYWTTADGTAAGGLIYLGPFWDLADGASVTIANGTWSDSTTTGAGGWYQFNESDGLADDEEYTITITKTGYATTSDNITCLADNFTRKDFYMNEQYAMTLHVKDADTSSYITSNVTAIVGSTTASATDGTVEFTGLTYGAYSLYVSADDYYASTGTIIVDAVYDSEAVYLTPKEEGAGDAGPGANYPPHIVRISYVDTWGNPIDGATVTATPIESSTPWEWVTGAFGFETSVDIQNETLDGTTGSDGTISFMMLETVRYSVNCVEAGSGVNHTFTMFPKESEYFIRIGTLPVVTAYPVYNLTAYDLNATHVRLSMNYTDTANQTSSARFIVENISGAEVYNGSVSLTNGTGSAYYDVANTKGDSYSFRFEAVNTQHGTITSMLGIDLKGSGRLVEFGWPALWYYLLSFGCLFMLAGAFGEMDVKIGGILVPLIGAGIFWYIGWLPVNLGSIIFVAVFVGVFYYMRAKLPAVTDG